MLIIFGWGRGVLLCYLVMVVVKEEEVLSSGVMAGLKVTYLVVRVQLVLLFLHLFQVSGRAGIFFIGCSRH